MNLNSFKKVNSLLTKFKGMGIKARMLESHVFSRLFFFIQIGVQACPVSVELSELFSKRLVLTWEVHIHNV